ncbi:MAG TPA: hypothetical protein VN622_12995 [Clostridia bacterium]|nr:hypothetical protein [Clostridia bacterium]
MTRWIAFDRQTAEKLRDGLGREVPLTLEIGTPVQRALAAKMPCVLVLPGRGLENTLLVTLQPVSQVSVQLAHTQADTTTNPKPLEQQQRFVEPAQPAAEPIPEAEYAEPSAAPVQSAVDEVPPAAETALRDAARSFAAEPIRYEAGGFLGLSDEPVFEDEPRPASAKPSWWHKLTK